MGDCSHLPNTHHHVCHRCCTKSQEGCCQAQGPSCPSSIRCHDQGCSQGSCVSCCCWKEGSWILQACCQGTKGQEACCQETKGQEAGCQETKEGCQKACS